MIGAIILGIVAGFLGRFLMPGKDPMGFFATILLGLAGSVVGFLIFTELFGIGDNNVFDLGGLIGAIIGVMILLGIYRFVAQAERAAGGTDLGDTISFRTSTALGREVREPQRAERCAVGPGNRPTGKQFACHPLRDPTARLAPTLPYPAQLTFVNLKQARRRGASTAARRASPRPSPARG